MKLVRYVNCALNLDITAMSSRCALGFAKHLFSLPELSANHTTRFLMKCANETVTIELKNGMCNQPTPRDIDLETT